MMNSSLQKTWEDVPNDPDPASDLGYEFGPLSAISVEEGDEKYICLPREENHLTDSEFLIADAGSVRDLDDCR